MKRKKNLIELIQAIITAYKSFSFTESMVNAIDLSLSVNKWDSIAYLMGIDLDIEFREWDEITGKYQDIFDDVCCNDKLAVNDAAHLLYSKFQTEIAKDLQQYPFLAVKPEPVANDQKAA
jgi:hypothetical protein